MRTRKNKLLLTLRAFIITVIGYYGMLHISGQIVENSVTYNIGKMVLAGIFISGWCYGMLALYDDFRSGGIRQIINRLKRSNGDL